MTDRLKGFVVTLKTDMREDDAKAVINAIRMIKGVLAVNPVTSNIDDVITRNRVRSELREKLFGLLE